jgi:DNA recombination protein RmuC
MRKHVDGLASKAYWTQFGRAPDLVVMFVNEAALVAALEAAPALIEDALGRKVMIATPTTLFALLSAVAFGWRQEQVAENAEAVAALGRDVYERVGVWVRHMGEVGAGLNKSLNAYNSAVGSLELRVLPAVRRFKELGVTTGDDLPELGTLDASPRRVEGAGGPPAPAE